MFKVNNEDTERWELLTLPIFNFEQVNAGWVTRSFLKSLLHYHPIINTFHSISEWRSVIPFLNSSYFKDVSQNLLKKLMKYQLFITIHFYLFQEVLH